MKTTRSEKFTEILKALIEATQGIYLKEESKAATRGGGSMKYAKLEDMLAVVRPALTSKGILPSWAWSTEEGTLTLTLTLLHVSGEWLESSVWTNLEGKSAQDVGTWLTYMRRYQLQSLLGIEPGGPEDCDGEEMKANDKPTTAQKKGKVDRQKEIEKLQQELSALPDLQQRAYKLYGEDLSRLMDKDIAGAWESVSRAKGGVKCA